MRGLNHEYLCIYLTQRMIGCSLYMIGDFLFAATGKTQSTESIGLMVKVAYLDMATWRMVVSIICGVLGTALYYIGFHQMWKLLKRHLTQPKLPWPLDQIDHGTESAGHLLVLALGLVLLREMAKSGECKETVQ